MTENINDSNRITDEQILELIQNTADDVNESLRKQLEDDEFAAVYEIVSYQQATGGKRLRPTIAVLISQVFGGDYKQTVDMATTAELLHNASLIFDDVLDGDSIRRGKPTAQAMYGAGTAMMGGNVLALLAFRLGGSQGFQLLRVLVDAASCLALGSTEEQLFHEYDEHRYLRIISLKTASLFEAPCKIGAIMAGVMRPEYEMSKQYGWNIGMVYQLTDDLVDILKTYKKGEPIGHMKNGTPTLAFIHAYHNTEDKLIKDLLEKFLKNPPLSMEEFNLVYHALEEIGSLAYTVSKIEEHNRKCYKYCLDMPTGRPRNYLLAMPSFMHRVLMREVQGLEGFEGMGETDEKV